MDQMKMHQNNCQFDFKKMHGGNFMNNGNPGLIGDSMKMYGNGMPEMFMQNNATNRGQSSNLGGNGN